MNTSTQPLSIAVMKTPIAAPAQAKQSPQEANSVAIKSLLNSLRSLESVIAIADGNKPSGDVLGLLESMGGLPEELYLVALKTLVKSGSVEDAKGAALILEMVEDLNSLEVESLAVH